MSITYDEAVDTAKDIIRESIKQTYNVMAPMCEDFDVAQVMADAQEELFADYLEDNGFTVEDPESEN